MDKALAKKKFALFDVALSKVNLENALEKAQADWTRDLWPLLTQLVPWKDAMTRVTPVLNELVS